MERVDHTCTKQRQCADVAHTVEVRGWSIACNLQRMSVLVCVSLAPRSQNVLGGCFGLLGVLALVVTLV